VRIVIRAVVRSVVVRCAVVIQVSLIACPIERGWRVPIVRVGNVITVVIATREQAAIIQRTEVVVAIVPIVVSQAVVLVVAVRPNIASSAWIVRRPIGSCTNVRRDVRDGVCPSQQHSWARINGG